MNKGDQPKACYVRPCSIWRSFPPIFLLIFRLAWVSVFSAAHLSLLYIIAHCVHGNKHDALPFIFPLFFMCSFIKSRLLCSFLQPASFIFLVCDLCIPSASLDCCCLFYLPLGMFGAKASPKKKKKVCVWGGLGVERRRAGGWEECKKGERGWRHMQQHQSGSSSCEGLTEEQLVIYRDNFEDNCVHNLLLGTYVTKAISTTASQTAKFYYTASAKCQTTVEMLLRCSVKRNRRVRLIESTTAAFLQSFERFMRL